MVLGGEPPGRVGHCQEGPFFCGQARPHDLIVRTGLFRFMGIPYPRGSPESSQFSMPALLEQVGVFEDIVGGALAPDSQQEVLVHQVREVAADGLRADIGAEGLVFAVGDSALLDQIAQRLLLARVEFEMRPPFVFPQAG